MCLAPSALSMTQRIGFSIVFSAVLSWGLLNAPGTWAQQGRGEKRLTDASRERQQVPELLNPESIRWRLLCGYLQTLGIPSGTTWTQQYPVELESWLNQIFYYRGEDCQYVSFSNGVVTVN